jgi:hypothetical protein
MLYRKNRSRKNRSNRRNTVRRNRSNRSNRRCWSRRNRNNMVGGGEPAPVNDMSMQMSMRNSLAQGQQYENAHRAQHGGAAPYPGGVTDSVLQGNLIPAARTGPLDVAISQIQGMQDGGRRRRRSKSRSKRGRRNGSSRRNRRGASRKLRGGAFVGAPVTQNAMLLPPGLEKQAALNYEWSLAKDPSSFAPQQ